MKVLIQYKNTIIIIILVVCYKYLHLHSKRRYLHSSSLKTIIIKYKNKYLTNERKNA